MAMLIKNKNITFSLVLICLIVVSPVAKAQLDGLLGRDPKIVSIQGRMTCSIDGNPISLLQLVGLLSFDQSCKTDQTKFAKLLQTIAGSVVDYVIVIVV
ncbi:hypothetical protein F2Q69_00003627 [Brassica cretica]|uniref:Uncharacterized protein n=1 Tax=Brassica cretica TaxID=69181 RepID=A0A8S9NRK1_BRACR|nr:hypothetical protein F2Q69_00003627 [Brassica cretica]